MKRLLVGLVLAALGFATIGVPSAAADPSVTLCHDVRIGVNGSDVVADAACNTAP